MNKKTVLIACTEHFEFMDETHPSGIFQRDLAIAYMEAGYRVAIVSFRFDDIRKRIPQYSFSRWRDAYVVRCVLPKLFPFRFIGFRAQVFLYNLGYNFVISKMQKKIKTIDFIHAHNLQFAGYACLNIANKKSLDLIITEHSSRFFNKADFNFEDEKNFIRLFENPNITAVSPKLANEINNKLSVKPVVIENILDPLFLDNSFQLERNKNQFITVGGLREIKNHSMLIRSFARLIHNKPNNFLYIIGEGDLKNELTSLINALNVDKHVKLLPNMARSDLKSFFESSDACIVSSKFETFGVVAIEALSSGLPVISTKNGGVESIITDSSLGQLVDITEDAIYEALLDFDASSFDRHKLRKVAKDRYSPGIIVSKFEQLLDQSKAINS